MALDGAVLYGGERVTKGTNEDKGTEDKGKDFFWFLGRVRPILFLEEDGFPGPINGGRRVEGSLERSS